VKETTITIAEAARDFPDCVERAHSENRTFIVVKNGVPLARVVPEGVHRCAGRDLAAALTKVSLSPDDARAWSEDLRSARNTLLPPEDKWR